MRTRVPAETLVYLETNDLAAALQPIIDSKPFTEVAKSKPDFSALKGVQLAVAVTGFETSEEKVNDKQSIGKVRPRFVAVADTHAWDYKAVKFAETRLDAFVQEMLGGGATMGRSQKSQQTGGTYITWAATDGRLAHALVIDGIIYFGNDETAIDKCLAVKRGEADSILKTGKVEPTEPGTIARGYVSTDGVANIASLVSVTLATVSELSYEARPAVAESFANLIRGSVAEIRWDSRRSDEGITDRFVASLPTGGAPDPDELWTETIDLLFESIESTATEDVVDVLSSSKSEAASASNTLHRREDRFTTTTAERRIVTDIGFIGWLIAHLNQD